MLANPWPSLAEFYRLVSRVRRELPRVRTPCLTVHAVEDDIASARNARIVSSRIGGPVESVWLDDSYHMITIDRQRRRWWMHPRASSIPAYPPRQIRSHMQSIQTRVFGIIADTANIDIEAVAPATTLHDLGVASLDAIEMLFMIEEKFGIELNDRDVDLRTPAPPCWWTRSSAP